MPHRLAPDRRRAAGSAAARDPGTSDRRQCRAPRRGTARAGARQSRRRSLARPDLWCLFLLPRRSGEPLRRAALHRLHAGRGLRRVRGRRCALLLSPLRRARRRARGATAVRGPDRLPLPAAGRRGTEPRTLRLRRRGPHRDPGRASPRSAGERVHAPGGLLGAGLCARARRELGRQLGRAPAASARRRDPVRTRRSPGADSPGGRAQGRQRDLRRHPHVGDTELPVPAVVGRAGVALGRESDPPRRPRVPGARRPDPDPDRSRALPVRGRERRAGPPAQRRAARRRGAPPWRKSVSPRARRWCLRPRRAASPGAARRARRTGARGAPGRRGRAGRARPR